MLCLFIVPSKLHPTADSIVMLVLDRDLKYKYLVLREYTRGQYVKSPGECPRLVTVASTGPALA